MNDTVRKTGDLLESIERKGFSIAFIYGEIDGQFFTSFGGGSLMGSGEKAAQMRKAIRDLIDYAEKQT